MLYKAFEHIALELMHMLFKAPQFQSKLLEKDLVQEDFVH